MTSKIVPSKSLLGAVFCGVLISLVTGFYKRNVFSIPEVRFYGYPLFWRITDLNGPTEYVLGNLALDAVVWAVISLLALFILQRVGAYFFKTSDTPM